MQELRYIGGPYRKKLISNLSLKNIEPAIDIMFNSNIFEAKLPVKLKLDSKYITITKNEQQVDDIKKAYLLHEAVKKLDYQKVETLLKQGLNPDAIINDYTPFFRLVTG